MNEWLCYYIHARGHGVSFYSKVLTLVGLGAAGPNGSIRDPRGPKYGQEGACGLDEDGLRQASEVIARDTHKGSKGDAQIAANDGGKGYGRHNKCHQGSLTTRWAKSRHQHAEGQHLEQRQHL